MSTNVTMADMLTAIAEKANIEKFVAESGALINNPELRRNVNEYTRRLYAKLVSAKAQEWYRKSFTFATNANQGEYSEPLDCLEMLSIDLYIAPNLVVTARPYQESERNAFRFWSGWVWPQPVYFRLLGTPQTTGAALQPRRINFIPQPAPIQTITCNYYPKFRPWATDGTEDNFIFDGINGWTAWVEWRVAAVALEKMEQNSEFALAQAAEIWAEVEEMAADRHAGDAERVHDTGMDYEPFGFNGMGGR